MPGACLRSKRLSVSILASLILSCRNSIGAMLFVEAAPRFINPSKVSPIRLSSQISGVGSSSIRLCVDKHVAVCVSAVFSTESVLTAPAKLGGNSERTRKWLSGVFHNQDWERFESLMCLVFGHHILYGQISPKKAISFQTMMNPLESVQGLFQCAHTAFIDFFDRAG